VEQQSAKMYKVCAKCKKEVPLSGFNRNKTKTDGYHHTCSQCRKVERAKSYQKHREKVLLSNKKFKEDNPDYMREYLRSYYHRNKPLYYRHAVKRRATKLNATPNWLTEEHNNEIQQFYWLAKDLQAITGETYHVDHIVPLKGENVCGLHVPWNLQVLPADINLSKGNKHADFTY
jgi:hypothetical protein